MTAGSITANVGLEAQGTTEVSADGEFSAGPAPDTKYQINAYVKHVKILVYTITEERGLETDPWIWIDTTGPELYKEGDVMGNYKEETYKKVRHWYDEEGVGAADVVLLT
jgi:hypothetical protein